MRYSPNGLLEFKYMFIRMLSHAINVKQNGHSKNAFSWRWTLFLLIIIRFKTSMRNIRPISEITDQDLINLINNQEENLWIDFKEMHYDGYKTDGEKYKREICKDVTAMANAEGGYILIGVDEENEIAKRFVDIPDAERKAESIYNTCHQHILPRIAKLEAKLHEGNYLTIPLL